MSLFGVNFSNDIQQTLNRSIASFSAPAIASCISEGKQKIQFLVDNSTIEISGDLVLAQEAKLVFSCVQSQKSNGNLINDFKTKLKSDLEQATEKALLDIGSANVANTVKQVSNIVENNVDLSLEANCTARLEQSSDTQIRNSRISVGNCSRDLLAAATETCRTGQQELAKIYIAGGRPSAEVERGMLATCPLVQTCAEKAGQFLIEQGIEFSAACEQIQNIAVEIANLLETELESSIKQTQKGFSLGIMEIGLIIGAVVLLLALISALVAYFKYKSSRKRKQEQGLSPYGAGEPYYAENNPTIGTSYRSEASAY